MDKVLLVEDDAAVASGLKFYLELKGYNVIHATDAQQGLHELASIHPDVIITDVIMPNMEGMEFLISLTEQKRNEAKIIAVSGGGHLPGEYYLSNAISLGADDFMEKPFSFADMHGKIQQLLQ